MESCEWPVRGRNCKHPPRSKHTDGKTYCRMHYRHVCGQIERATTSEASQNDTAEPRIAELEAELVQLRIYAASLEQLSSAANLRSSTLQRGFDELMTENSRLKRTIEELKGKQPRNYVRSIMSSSAKNKLELCERITENRYSGKPALTGIDLTTIPDVLEPEDVLDHPTDYPVQSNYEKLKRIYSLLKYEESNPSIPYRIEQCKRCFVEHVLGLRITPDNECKEFITSMSKYSALLDIELRIYRNEKAFHSLQDSERKSVYRKLILKWHTDKSSSQRAVVMCQKLNMAYEPFKYE
jgi:hypothetical protein